MKDALSGTLLAAVIFSFPASSTSLSYFAMDLGAVTATGINASGDVVGTANNRAFLYHNGIFTFIDSAGSSAVAINASGQIVGRDNSGIFLYDGGMLTRTPFDFTASPYAINSSGAFVGETGAQSVCPDGNHNSEAFVYSNGTLTCLGAEQSDTSPTDMNDSGVIVGYTGGPIPFIYSDGAFSRIPL